MFWKKGLKVIIDWRTIVTITPSTKNLLNLSIFFPLTIKANIMWDAIRRLNTIVLAMVSEVPFPRRVLNTRIRANDIENPIVPINNSRPFSRIGASGFLGFLFRTLWSLLSDARAKAGRPSVTKLIHKI